MTNWEPRGCHLAWVGESDEMSIGPERILPFHRFSHGGFDTQAQGFTGFLFPNTTVRIVLISDKSLLNTSTIQAAMKNSPLFILNF